MQIDGLSLHSLLGIIWPLTYVFCLQKCLLGVAITPAVQPQAFLGTPHISKHEAASCRLRTP